MNERSNSTCPCATCPGSSCACGCQSPAVRSLQAGGAACACQAACGCDAAESGCHCADPAQQA